MRVDLYMAAKKLSALCIAICFTICLNAQQTDNAAQILNASMRKVTDVIVHDVFTPPVAGRIYAYSGIAAYEVMQLSTDNYNSFAGKLNGLQSVTEPTVEIDYSLAASVAMLSTARGLIFSEQMMDDNILSIISAYYLETDTALINRSLQYGIAVSKEILSWASKDNYKETRSYPRYTLRQSADAWEPTPPDYADGIEPYWNKIRPFTLDSAAQFKPAPPTVFSAEKNSAFYNEAMEVYQISKSLSEQQILSVKFWDDNPFTTYYVGHLQYAHKKITPGGHWIDITREAISLSGCDGVKAAFAYAMVGIALHDGFISCWDEKYRSSLIRPETYINKYIDQQWRPFLQTPPFPEYTSGHSVISAAAATVLTDIFGEPFAFTDSIETEYDLPAKSFQSFREASNDAAYSRMNGGIHYRPAIEVGITQGINVGNQVWRKSGR